MSQGVISRFFSWLFGTSKKENIAAKEQRAVQQNAEVSPESKRPSLATTNMLNTLDKLAKHVSDNPLDSRGEQRLSFDGLTQSERERHLKGIKENPNGYLSELKKLSPSDQFQVILLLARELRNSTGTSLSSMPEPEPWEGDLSKVPEQIRGAVSSIRNLGPQIGPQQIQESLKDMGASLVRSKAATSQQIAGYLQPALSGLDNPMEMASQLNALRNEIEDRALKAPETRVAGPSPMDSRNATMVRGAALVREADVQMQDMRSAIGAIISGPGNPDSKILGTDSRLASMLQKFMDAQATGAISRDELNGKFQQAFKLYNDMADALGKENPEVRSARPEKMLALLDKFNE